MKKRYKRKTADDYVASNREQSYCIAAWSEFTTLTAEEMNNLKEMSKVYGARIWNDL